MRIVKFIGIILILVILGSIVPYNITRAEGNYSQKFNAYKEMLNRALNLPYLTPELRSRIEKVVNSEPTNIQEAKNLIAEAKNILKDIENLAEERSDVGWKIEEKELSSVITVLTGFAEEVNATDIETLLSEAQALLDKGDVKEAREVLNEALKDIREIRAEASSEAVEESTVATFKSISSNETALEGVVQAISNINMTLNVLNTLKLQFIGMNASEETINTLDRVITTLNSTISILENIVVVVETAGVEERVGNVTEKIAANDVLEETSELRIDIEELLSETVYLEQQLNISLEDIRSVLTDCLNLLNESENLVSAGEVGKGLQILSDAKTQVKNVKEVLDRYEETLENSLKEESALQEYVAKKLGDVKDSYRELLNRSQELYGYALAVNVSQALTILVEVNGTLCNVSIIINETESMVMNGEYDKALNLLNTAEEKLDYVDKLLDKAKKLLQVTSETIKEIVGKISGLRIDLMHLKYKVNESLNGLVLEKALEVIDRLMERLNEAETTVRNGDFQKAGEIITEVKNQINILEECIGEVGDLAGKISDLRGIISELRDKYANNTVVMQMLDEAEQFLNETEILLGEAVEQLNPGLLNEAENLINNVKDIIKSVNEESHGEEYHIGFRIVNSLGNPLSNATIVFNGTEYHDGEATYIVEGVYELSVGEVPEGYALDHWMVMGDIEMQNNTAASAEAVVKGDGEIILVLRKTIVKEFTINFCVEDTYGNTISNATIILNGVGYSNGSLVMLAEGEYSLSTGMIPKGYEFKFWFSEGNIIISDSVSSDTEVIVRGDGVIILVLQANNGEGLGGDSIW